MNSDMSQRPNDRSVPADHFLSESNIEALYRIVAERHESPAVQTELVALALIGGVTPEQLRAKLEMVDKPKGRKRR